MGFPNGKETVNLAEDVVQRLEEGEQSDETFEESHNAGVDSNVGPQKEDVDTKANTGEREINEGDDDQSDLRLERSFLFEVDVVGPNQIDNWEHYVQKVEV